MRAPPPEGARAFARARASDGNDLRTVWPSGLRRSLQAPVRKGVGSNPTAVTFHRLIAFEIATGLLGTLLASANSEIYFPSFGNHLSQVDLESG